jgi:acetyltransferase-like isoleucine patch superfamily enzyme
MMLKKLYIPAKTWLTRTVIVTLKGRNAWARYCGVTVGSNCRLLITRWGSEPFLISIGDNVTITAGTRLVTHDGSLWLISDGAGRRFQYRRISIGSNVFIGVNTIVLPGVQIGDNVIIGAGSVVTKSIPSGKIVAGNPARIIGEFDAYKLKALKEFPAEQQMLKDEYRKRVLHALDGTFKPSM